MLSYAFHILKESNYEEIAAESFEHIHDLFAAILVKGVSKQLKQGLYKEYINKEESLTTLRGKLNLSCTIKNRIQQKQLLSCEFDEMTENNIFNQIIKTTMLLLIRQKTVKQERKVLLKKALLLFDGIEVLDISSISFDRLRFQKNNQNYKMLMFLCKFVIEGMIMSDSQGNIKLSSFLDEQHMYKLYEKFVLEYYKYHFPQVSVSASQIPWDLDDGFGNLLPVMQSDIMLKYKDRIHIIDTKYYAKTMQNHFNTNTFHSGNLYQIYTYVKNTDKNHTGNVSGMLLYAKTEEQITPNSDFWMGGNQISVKTLDLNEPFSTISSQLNHIMEDYVIKKCNTEIEANVL